jgi:hypothetical protein
MKTTTPRKAKTISKVNTLDNHIMVAHLICGDYTMPSAWTPDMADLMTLANNVVPFKKPEAVASKKKAQNLGVGDLAKSLIKQGLGNKDVLAKVHAHFGNTNTTYACIAWYRNDMKSKGEI